MSDAKDSDGTFEDLLSAHDSVNWEKRLELARQQRAKVLAQANGSDPPQPDQNSKPEQPFDRPEPRTTVEQAFIEPQPEPENPRRMFGNRLIVPVALICGALVGWGLSQFANEWQEAQAMPAPPVVALSATTEQPDASKPANIGPEPAELGYGPMAQTTHPSHFLAFMPPGQVVLTNPPSPLPVPEMNPDYVTVDNPPQPKVVSLPEVTEEVPVTPEPANVTLDEDVTDAAVSAEDTDQPSALNAVPAPIEVALFVPSTVSTDTSNRALAALKNERSNVVATARVGYSVRETHVRYYHPNDEAHAILAADALGGISRDFTGSGTKTPPGRIEVYIQGTAQRTQPRNEQTEFERFLARLIAEIQ